MFYYCIILTSATCFGTFFGHHQAINQGLRVTQYLHYVLTLQLYLMSLYEISYWGTVILWVRVLMCVEGLGGGSSGSWFYVGCHSWCTVQYVYLCVWKGWVGGLRVAGFM